jgi:hypothetical protein
MTEPELIHQLAKSYSGSVWVTRVGKVPQLLERMDLPENIPGSVLGRLVDAASACRDLYGPCVATPSVVTFNNKELTVATAYEEMLPLKTLLQSARVKACSFPVAVALRIALDALEGLATMHRHVPDCCGGVTPEQLWIGVEGVTRVANVGLAAVAATAPPWSQHVDRVAYLAREQVTLEAPACPSTDVYAIGVLLWEMLSGRRMLVGSSVNMRETLVRGRTESVSEVAFPRVADFPIQTLEHALQPRIEARLQTTHDFVQALERSGVTVGRPPDVADFVQDICSAQLQLLRSSVGKRRESGGYVVPLFPSVPMATAVEQPKRHFAWPSTLVGAAHSPGEEDAAPSSRPRVNISDAVQEEEEDEEENKPTRVIGALPPQKHPRRVEGTTALQPTTLPTGHGTVPTSAVARVLHHIALFDRNLALLFLVVALALALVLALFLSYFLMAHRG